MIKKSIFMAAMMLAATMSAQNITYYMGETPLSLGETYEYNSYTYQEFMPGYGSVTVDPDMQIMCDRDATVNITADCTTGHTISMCCGGQCLAAVKVEKKNIELTGDQKLPLQLEYLQVTDDVSSIGKIEVALSTEVANTIGGKSYDVNLVFDLLKGSVSLVEADNTIQVGMHSLKYDVEGSATLMIFDAQGKCVASHNVAGQGSVATDELPQGIYFYTLNTVKKHTGKFYVK